MMYVQQVANRVKIGWQFHNDNDNHGILTHSLIWFSKSTEIFMLEIVSILISRCFTDAYRLNSSLSSLPYNLNDRSIAWHLGLTENRVPVPSTVLVLNHHVLIELAILEAMPICSGHTQISDQLPYIPVCP